MVPANGTRAIAAASTVKALRSSAQVAHGFAAGAGQGLRLEGQYLQIIGDPLAAQLRIQAGGQVRILRGDPGRRPPCHSSKNPGPSQGRQSSA